MTLLSPAVMFGLCLQVGIPMAITIGAWSR